ncbi:MAG TPA: dTMP kinase [bacterium]|nr:dTMP kinase [bacterium]
MSLFITFEGGEGSGKTTQIQMLAAALNARGLSVLATREPGGTETGKEIRRILLDEKNGHLAPLTELMLYAADRAQHVAETIRPALSQGKIVLCDRFTDATVAYQGFGRGLDLKLIQTLNELATQRLKPDLTFLLDLPVAIGLKRAKSRLEATGKSEGRFEAEAEAFHEKIRQAYLQLAKAEPKRFILLHADDEIDGLHRQILAHILAVAEARILGQGTAPKEPR